MSETTMALVILAAALCTSVLAFMSAFIAIDCYAQGRRRRGLLFTALSATLFCIVYVGGFFALAKAISDIQ